jgi:tetratricopeptide (TPR) repeat protein
MISFLVALLLISGCGGSGQKYVAENPYAERMKELSLNGVAAMERERWDVAEKLFDRALQAAQLANDPNLIAVAWYNLGMLHVSSGDGEKGSEVLKKAVKVAVQHHLQIDRIRAEIALALLNQRHGEKAWQPEVLEAALPEDIHLSAARLAQLQDRFDVARREYEFVLRKRDSNRAIMLYKVEAHMGLALLAHQLGNFVEAKKETENVLKKSREVGSPRIAAHALLLSAKLDPDEASKQDSLQDALAIYQALDDRRGQKETLSSLIELASGQGDHNRMESLQQRLQELEKR